MLSPSLIADIELIQTFCRQNSVALFYGIPENSACAPCRWNYKTPDALQAYLAALLRAEAKILHLSVTQNELSPGDWQAIKKAIPGQPKQKQKALKGFVERLQKEKGAPLTLVATFFHGGTQYIYISRSPLSIFYNTLLDLVGGKVEKQEGDPLEQPKKPMLFSDYIAARKTPKETIAVLARKIASDSLYIHARHETERKRMAKARAEREVKYSPMFGQKDCSCKVEQVVKRRKSRQSFLFF